jgi:hypothetical protein
VGCTTGAEPETQRHRADRGGPRPHRRRPRAGDANQRALSIAIHQFHGHTIALKDYKVEGNSFSGKLVFHSYDHFGLDPDDEITEYGFIDWFTLQHYDRFDGKYPPADRAGGHRGPHKRHVLTSPT